MIEDVKRKVHSGLPVLLSGALLLIGLAATTGVTLWHRQQNQAFVEQAFAKLGDKLTESLRERFTAYNHGLQGLRGIFIATPDTDRKTFAAYVASRDLENEFPGAIGMGFVRHVPRQEIDAFVERRRAELGKDFAIKRQGSNPGNAMIIDYFAPAGNNTPTIGFDIGSDPARREAAMRSMWTGEPALSAPLTRVNGSTGLALLLPIYHPGLPVETVQQRTEAIFGWALMSLDIDKVLPGLADNLFDYELFDVTAEDESFLIFDADRHLPVGAQVAAAVADNQQRGLLRSYDLKFGNRSWNLLVSPHPPFWEQFNLTSPVLTALGGAVLSLLLATVIYLLMVTQRRAEALAGQMTEKLRMDEERARDFSMSASDSLWETDAQHRYSYLSDNCEKLYDLKPEQVLGKSRCDLLLSSSLNPAELVAIHLAQLESHAPFKGCEYRLRGNDGLLRWVSASLRAVMMRPVPR